MKRSSITTRRLILRPYRITDYTAWYDAYVNRLPKLNRFDRDPSDPKECGKSAFRRIVFRHKELASKDQTYIYGVFEKNSKRLIGAIDIHVISRDHYQMANFGYQIHNRYWGNNYGKEAATAGLKIGFTHLKLNRLEAAINLDNHRSLALSRAIGMRREGIKKRYIYEDGKWTDHVIFAANPEDIGLKPSPPI